jgi:hypothetical protein
MSIPVKIWNQPFGELEKPYPVILLGLPMLLQLFAKAPQAPSQSCIVGLTRRHTLDVKALADMERA